MKTTLEFNEEEQQEANIALNGWRYHSVIWDLKEYLRSEMKHGDLSDIQYVCFEKIQNQLFNLIEMYKADLE